MVKPLYLCYFKPYLTRLDQLSDFSNDLLLIVVHILQVVLTQYTYSDQVRYDHGWSYSYIIVAIFLFNFFIVGYIQIVYLYRAQRQKYLNKKKKQMWGVIVNQTRLMYRQSKMLKKTKNVDIPESAPQNDQN